MISLPQSALSIIQTLRQHGYEGYAVGGSVRDLIMDKPTRGWDFTTNATPEQILELFPDSYYDNQFGTVGVKIYTSTHDKSTRIIDDIYEITTYRSEKGYGDFRHPDAIVWGTNLEEDLSRRDFTINAIAYDGTTIVDPYHGQDDIKAQLVRAVGNPEDRFTEDALRMMRAIRIASQIGFQVESETFAGISKTAPLIEKISKERVRDELLKILTSAYPGDGILLMKNSGLLIYILPELERCFGVEQKSPKRHHIFDVGTHLIESVKRCPSDDPIVRLATLLHDIGKPQTFHKDETGLITFYNHEMVSTKLARSIAERLRLSKKQSELFLTLIRWHQFSVDERQTDSAIRRIIRRVGKENMDAMLSLRIADRLGGGAQETSWRLELFKQRIIEVQKQPFSVKDLKVNGFDVMNILNCTPGKIVGSTLESLFTEVERGTLPNEREKLIGRIRELQKK